MAIFFVFFWTSVSLESLYLYRVLIDFSRLSISSFISSSLGIVSLELCLVIQLNLSNIPM